MDARFGEIISNARESRDISRNELAGKIGISMGYLSQLENGKKQNPSIDIILKLIRELNLDIDTLLNINLSKDRVSAQIPYIIKLTLAKDRNVKVLEDLVIQKLISSIMENLLEKRHLISEREEYINYLKEIMRFTDFLEDSYCKYRDINGIKLENV